MFSHWLVREIFTRSSDAVRATSNKLLDLPSAQEWTGGDSPLQDRIG